MMNPVKAHSKTAKPRSDMFSRLTTKDGTHVMKGAASYTARRVIGLAVQYTAGLAALAGFVMAVQYVQTTVLSVGAGKNGVDGLSANITAVEEVVAVYANFNASLFKGDKGETGDTGAWDANSVLHSPTITGNGTWESPTFQDATASTLRVTDTLFADHIWSIGSTQTIGSGPSTRHLHIGLSPNISFIHVGATGPVNINVGNALSRLNLFGAITEVVAEIVRTNQTVINLNDGGPFGSAGMAGVYVGENDVFTPLVRVAGTRDAVELQAPAGVLMRLDQSVDTTSSPMFVDLSLTTLNGRSVAAMITTLESIEATRATFVATANASLIALQGEVIVLHAIGQSLNATMAGNVARVTALATSFNASIWEKFTGTESVLSALAVHMDSQVASLNSSVALLAQSTTSRVTSLNASIDALAILTGSQIVAINANADALQSTVSTLLVSPAITSGGSWTGAPTIATTKGPGTAIFSLPTLSADDVYAMVDATQTLGAKTLLSPTVTGMVDGSATYITPIISVPAVTNGTFESPQINHILSPQLGATLAVTGVHANAAGLVLSAGSNDVTGVVSFTPTGAMTTTQTSGACTKIVTVVFTTPYPHPPGVLLVPADVLLVHQIGTGNRMPFYQSTESGFSVCAGTAAIQNGNYIALRYFVIG